MSSPIATASSNLRFEFTSTAFGRDKFAVVEMEGFESISRPFRFTLTLVSADVSIDFHTMLAGAATFVIYGPDGALRTPYHGVLAEFEQLHRVDGYVFYRAVLVPRLWRLSLFRISEVYLNEQTIPKIIEHVLKEGRLSPADYEFRLTDHGYRTRSYVCQYEETYLDFISRWMEKEGIYYYFDHSGEVEKLIVLDDKIMQHAEVLPVSYRPDDSLDTGIAADSVRNLVVRQKPLPREVVLRDYNYRKAALPLTATAVVDEGGFGDVMLYGENFRDEAEGKRYANLRAQEILCEGRVFLGEGTAVGVRSGYVIELAHHYRDDFNGQYLVTEVHHEGSQAGVLLNGVRVQGNGERGGEIIYRNSFRAIPVGLQFRAERKTVKPRVAGTMNAMIDSEGTGQYADLDEYGQYKVQLPFDKTDKNANKGSARLRMASPYSGSDHGMHFPLHKDAEVLLSFIDGDPDQPVIVGSLPNSENANIVTQENAHVNRIKTAGGNQIYLGDSKGKEVMTLHSPSSNTQIRLGANDSGKGGGLQFLTMGSTQSITVGSSLGVSVGPSVKLAAGPAFSLSAAWNTSLSLGSNVSVSWSNNFSYGLGYNASLSSAESVTLSEKGSTKGAQSVLLAAGLNPAQQVAIDAAKKAVKIATGAAAVAGLASAAIATGTVIKSADGNKTTKLDGDNWLEAGGMIGELGVSAVGLGAQAWLMRKAQKKIAQVQQAANYRSTVQLDDAGVNMVVRQDWTSDAKSQFFMNGDSVAIQNKSGLIRIGKWLNPAELAAQTAEREAKKAARKLASESGPKFAEDASLQEVLNKATPAFYASEAEEFLREEEEYVFIENHSEPSSKMLLWSDGEMMLDSTGKVVIDAGGALSVDSGEDATLASKGKMSIAGTGEVTLKSDAKTTVSAGAGTVTIEPAKITMKATELSLTGGESTTLGVSAAGISITSTKVDFKSDGPLTLKGGVIQIG